MQVDVSDAAGKPLADAVVFLDSAEARKQVKPLAGVEMAQEKRQFVPGVLVTQGSREGTQPVVSPNSGQLRTVGPLGLGPLTDVSFDIADVGNTALIAVRTAADTQTRLHQVDLATGATRPLGVVGDGAPLVGLAIEP